MKKKRITLTLFTITAISLLTLTACGEANTSSDVSSFEEASSAELALSSESLGIYAHDTDNDGTLDTVVDRYGNDLSEQYTIKEDGIYEGVTLLVAIENVQTYVPVDEIALTIESKTVHPDTEFTLDLVITPEDATTKEFELTTDNAEVLKIENGNITALANGEATVTATAKAGGASTVCKVIVNAEAEETQTQNEEAAASGGTIHSSNTNNTYSGGSTTANTNTGNNPTYTPPSNGNNGGNTNTGTTTSPQQQTVAPVQPQPTVHQPIYTQQWVVDQAAWTEEVPVWGNKYIEVCNTCGADITDNPTKHLEESLYCMGYHTDMIKIQTGTKTIQHEEQGHYESVLVCGGCTGTH